MGVFNETICLILKIQSATILCDFLGYFECHQIHKGVAMALSTRQALKFCCPEQQKTNCMLLCRFWISDIWRVTYLSAWCAVGQLRLEGNINWMVRCIIRRMTSSNGNFFCITGPLCGKFTSQWWIPCTKASDAELWCFLWSARTAPE